MKNIHAVYLDALGIAPNMLNVLEKEVNRLDIHLTTAPEQVIERCQSASVIITNKVKITKDHLDKLPQIQLIVAAATGTDHIDKDTCKAKGITVQNVAGYSTNGVAQQTIAAALHFIMQFDKRNEYVQSKAYSESGIWFCEKPVWQTIDQMKWGIIGLGNIGKKVASIAKSFGAEVMYYSASGKNNSQEYHRVDLQGLLETCDIISIHAPGKPSYYHLLNEETFKWLNKKAILINAGRGNIIDIQSAANWLKSNPEGKMAIDVYPQEPPVSTNPIFDEGIKDQLLLTPHSAWSSISSREKLIEGIAQRIQEHYTA